MTQSKLRELRHFKAQWERQHSLPRSRNSIDAFARETMRRVEMWLDLGMGECILKSSTISAIVANKMSDDAVTDVELGCYVIMPNHVHAVLRPLQPARLPLENILRLWKGGSARDVNQRLRSAGTIWQRESFDRKIRDAERLYRVIQYIGRNPAKAGLQAADARLWIRPAWVECGCDFEHGPPGIW